MPAATARPAPSLGTFLKDLKSQNVDKSIELLVSLLKRRQIRNSRPCAIATARLLLQVVAQRRWQNPQELIRRIREVGHKLVTAQPREMAVGNITRRTLGLVREVVEEDEDPDQGGAGAGEGLPSPAVTAEPVRPSLHTNLSSFSPLHHGAALPQTAQTQPSVASSPSLDGKADSSPRRPHMQSGGASYVGQGPDGISLFGLFQPSAAGTPMGSTSQAGSGTASPVPKAGKKIPDEVKEKLDIKAEVIEGIKDILDELDSVDSQIAESALDHIHNNEIILTHTSSQTVQRFLTTAARKRKFTVIHAEAYPNDHETTHAMIVNGGVRAGDEEEGDERWKPLTAMGIQVILIPDSAVFALMSRINKVILAPHTVLANGSLIAAAGASTIAQAAKAHHVPVVVLSGVYKLSPVYPFDNEDLIEYGDPSKVVAYEEGDFIDKVDVINPLYDHVDAELVDLYITNLGGHAPSYLYKIVADHYRTEDIDLASA
ncbi:translation initiation factor eIF-2B subunit beta [Lecanosticta acicola]|uniref:Translation initiation factor eIF2B subunit beta n=1 Tax=Lecanosticta acicola TaxID=111012 RepID=A0AAI8Z5U5_9PEZI|nr:translation initiation factor eIF-2B subunit beta [Lecanosticta acicola]